jgi:drug/metabolite transporter (DMT)-like permease
MLRPTENAGQLVFGEQPGWVTLIGGAIIVGGVILTNTRGRPRAKATTQRQLLTR